MTSMKNRCHAYRCPPRVLLVFLVFLAVLPSAGRALADRPLKVTVSILPQVWFAERIGGDRVEVEAMVGPGHSPATFEPTTRQMARLEDAAVYFSIGVPFEQGLLGRIAAMRSAPPIHGPRPQGDAHAGQDHAGHDHGDGHHHCGDIDPHIWLDPMQAATVADTMAAVLSRLDPAGAEQYLERARNLRQELTRLAREIGETLRPVQGRTFFVYHPAYGHFAAAFGLQQAAIEVGGREPGPRQLAEVIDEIKRQKADVIVVQPQFSQKSARSISRATGASLLPLDPLAAEYDTNLRHIAAELARALQGNRP